MARMDLGTIVLDLAAGMGSRRRTARIELPVSDMYPMNVDKDAGVLGGSIDTKSASWVTLREAVAYVEGLPGHLLLTENDVRLRMEGKTQMTVGDVDQHAKRAWLMNDALDAIWFRVPCSETRPDRAWNRERPMEVMEAVHALVNGRGAREDGWHRSFDELQVAYDKAIAALDRLWLLAGGEDGDDWTVDGVVDKVRDAFRGPLDTTPEGHDGCDTCTDAACLRDAGCGHWKAANDVPAATDGEIKRFTPPMQVMSVALVDRVVNPDTAFANGGFTPARPGCYTTEPVDPGAGCSGVGSNCAGCAASKVEAVLDDPFPEIEVVTDPTIPPDQVVMRSTTVDGKQLDEVEVRVELVPGVGPVVAEIDDDVATERAFDVHRELDLTDRRALSMLLNHGPQTALRLGGLCDLDMESPAPVMVAFERIVRLGLVVSESRSAEEGSGKPRPDLLKLTPLGREVARVLSAKE